MNLQEYSIAGLVTVIIMGVLLMFDGTFRTHLEGKATQWGKVGAVTGTLCLAFLLWPLVALIYGAWGVWVVGKAGQKAAQKAADIKRQRS